jgi:predicted component of type VI protein secretion system
MTDPANTDLSEVSALAEALRKRLAVIADRGWYARDSAGHLEALKSVSERIERLSATLPSPVDPQLRHYLERRSYDKALEFLCGPPQDPRGR